MAARGTESKKIITEKILETFPGAFLCNNSKELRIPLKEDGYRVEIKVTLTCAKDNLGTDNKPFKQVEESKKEEPPKIYPTEKEQENLHALMESLGIL